MKWKIRPGFVLHDSMDAAIESQLGNRSIRPRAVEGAVVVLTPEQLSVLVRQNMLGALIPCDGESDRYFGNTVALKAKGLRTDPPAQIDSPYSPAAA